MIIASRRQKLRAIVGIQVAAAVVIAMLARSVIAIDRISSHMLGSARLTLIVAGPGLVLPALYTARRIEIPSWKRSSVGFVEFGLCVAYFLVVLPSVQ